MKNVFISLFIILSLTYCAQPPTIEKVKQIIPDTPSAVKNDKNTNLSFKRLASASTKIENSKLTVNFEGDYQTLEHQLTIVPDNLESGYYITGWSVSTDSEGIELNDISNTCELVDESNGKSTKKDCTASQEKNGDIIRFSYKCEMYSTDKLIVTYKYKKAKKTKQILYKTEPINIPTIKDASNCDYKFTIPEGYINLGLENNILKKESDTVYSFKGKCPSGGANEIIRYSPEEVTWDADMKYILKSSEPLSNEIIMNFPRYYKGGKLKNDIYKITDSNNGNYDENEIIDKDDETKYNIKIPAPNKNDLEVELSTNFTNKLTNEFNVYVPEKYYDIDLTKVPKEIQDKAKEVIKENFDFPDYYKLGKFVYSYMTYNLSYTGKNLTLQEIYEGKKGVCEHYTLLYNAMLNSIGIKTLYIAGWAFDKDQTSGDKDTVGHAWTAAFIDGKWKELDATWGLFEGIPAGHIYKNFGFDKYSYSTRASQVTDINFENNPSIKMNKIIQGSKGNEKEEKTDEKKTDTDVPKNTDDNDEDIPTIRRSEGYCLKSSLILLSIFFLF